MPNQWVKWGELFNLDMKPSFKSTGDELPEGITKVSHTQGVVAKVKWTPIGNANGYTGFFNTGADENIIMRLSETGMLHEKSAGLTPSVAFKWLRDGTYSDNIVAMPSFLGSKSWNFLENDMATKVPHFDPEGCESNTLRKALGKGNRQVFSTGTAEFAYHKADGTDALDPFAYDDVKMPFTLKFAANEPFATMFSATKELDSNGNQVSWMDQMKRIKAGDAIFTAKALTKPESLGGTWVDIGTITLTSDMTTSRFADERMFFNHIRKDFDVPFYDFDWMVRDHKEDNPKCYA